MKRIGGLFDIVTDVRTIVYAAGRAAIGKRGRPEVARFLDALPERASEIVESLREGSFSFEPYTSFAIRDPKSRVIRAPSFRDRVVHHALIAATGPVFERGAIHASCACRTSRGQALALDLARRHGRSAEAFLKLDVAKYYDSISHRHLRRRLSSRFRETRLLAIFDRLLESYSTRPERGLPIGALTSQYLGNFVLDPVDHWIVETLRPHGYVRYMDDMLVFDTLDRLRTVRLEIEARLADMDLSIKHGGVLNRCELGVPWLGFTLYPTRTRLDARGRRRLRRRWGTAERAHARGTLTERELQDRTTSMFAHASRADDRAWRSVVLSFSRLVLSGSREAQERPEPRHARRLLEQLGQELPLGDPEQEEALEPQYESGLPSLSAPRHGGAEVPPDDAPSGAPRSLDRGDEACGRAPIESEIQRGASSDSSVPAEKVSVGAPRVDREGGDHHGRR
ncbi:MAG: RNA-directed DNA polymerase [Planctomycetes bacterium]|nr:RNA-directed DNA polymerase [Planctomycetota bacterium]MCC7171095.1 RNA-directed DNA polymerase [Planctomycetota bacterium]